MTSEFPAQRASNVEDVSIWWRRHEIMSYYGYYLYCKSNQKVYWPIKFLVVWGNFTIGTFATRHTAGSGKLPMNVNRLYLKDFNMHDAIQIIRYVADWSLTALNKDS